MPYNSVNTNVGAMVALQNLNATNSDLAMAQNRINTGKKVANAKDNGAVWAIAQNQRAACRWWQEFLQAFEPVFAQNRDLPASVQLRDIGGQGFRIGGVEFE